MNRSRCQLEGIDSGWPTEPCIRWRPDPQEEGVIFRVDWPIKKHCESLLRCTQQKKSVTASAQLLQASAPDWPVSH